MEIPITNMEGETDYVNFDMPINYNLKPSIVLSINIILLFQLSDTDTEYNILYYVSNMVRFNTLHSYGIDEIIKFIRKYSNNYQEYTVEEINNIECLIKCRYEYIEVLQILSNKLGNEYFDNKYLL